MRGSLEEAFAFQAARDWRALGLTEAEKAVLDYAAKGTVDEASVRKPDVDELRKAGLSDRDVLIAPRPRSPITITRFAWRRRSTCGLRIDREAAKRDSVVLKSYAGIARNDIEAILCEEEYSWKFSEAT